MLVLIIKIILAFLLTAIPFLFHYWIKPKSEIHPKWKSLFSFLEYSRPAILRKKRKLKVCYYKIIRRLKFSVNARKLFTYILIFVLLAIQVVDYHSSLYAHEKLDTYGTMVSNSPLVENAQGNLDIPAVIWNANTTPFGVLATCLTITLLLFSFRLANLILTNIHNGKRWRQLLIATIILLIPIGCGRLFLLSETLYTLLLAGILYPNLDFRAEDKWRRSIGGKRTVGLLYLKILKSLRKKENKAA